MFKNSITILDRAESAGKGIDRDLAVCVSTGLVRVAGGGSVAEGGARSGKL